MYLCIFTAIRQEGDNILAILEAITTEKMCYDGSEKVHGLLFEGLKPLACYSVIHQ